MVALVCGGYIHKFKGFGLELESKLQAPVAVLGLTVAHAAITMPGTEKENIRRLGESSGNELSDIKRLSFIMGKKDYYGQFAIIEYFKRLKHLEFVEVKRQTGAFVCLIPMSAFKTHREENRQSDIDYGEVYSSTVSRFITALEQETVLDEFHDVCILTTVRRSDGLINVLERLRSHNSEYAIVVSAEGKFSGVVTLRAIEKKIADDVLQTQKAERMHP